MERVAFFWNGKMKFYVKKTEGTYILHFDFDSKKLNRIYKNKRTLEFFNIGELINELYSYGVKLGGYRLSKENIKEILEKTFKEEV